MEFVDIFAYVGATFVVLISIGLIVGMTLMDRAGDDGHQSEQA